ncbi:MAG: GNAT family N-acetyltransferase [Bacteroidales bacterium]|nr:GNAT family N-acetyltransferase [Bacteroidales bacterium]
MERFFVRDFSLPDYNEVFELWESLGLSRKERGDTAEVITNTIENGGKLFLLIDSQNYKIIGTSWLSNDHRRLYLHHFAVKKEYQGQGLSHILVDESLKFVKELKLQVKLEVHQSNQKAINLYKKSGFKFLGDYDVYIVRDV